MSDTKNAPDTGTDAGSASPAPDTAPFALPFVHMNAAGWGPTTLPKQYATLPFAPFSRTDRVGRAADFGNYIRYMQREYLATAACICLSAPLEVLEAFSCVVIRAHSLHRCMKNIRHKPTFCALSLVAGGRFGRGDENVDLAYSYNDAEARDFALVDTAKAPRRGGPTGMRGRGGRGGFGYGRGGFGRGGAGVGGTGTRGYDDRDALAAGRAGTRGTGGTQVQGTGFNKRYERFQNQNRRGHDGRGPRGGRDGFGFGGSPGSRREPSVKVEEDWIALETFNLPELTKLSTGVGEPVDLLWAGDLGAYDDEIDRVTAKAPRKLKRFEDLDFYYKTAAEDPHMEQMAQDGSVGNVFATDVVLAQLMACPRGANPWDLVITVLPGGIIFLGERPLAPRFECTVDDAFTKRNQHTSHMRTPIALQTPVTLLSLSCTPSTRQRTTRRLRRLPARVRGQLLHEYYCSICRHLFLYNPCRPIDRRHQLFCRALDRGIGDTLQLHAAGRCHFQHRSYTPATQHRLPPTWGMVKKRWPQRTRGAWGGASTPMIPVGDHPYAARPDEGCIAVALAILGVAVAVGTFHRHFAWPSHCSADHCCRRGCGAHKRAEASAKPVRRY